MKKNGKRKARSNGAREPHKLFDLSPKKIRALEALLTASSVTDAAKMAGVDRTTLHRWLSDDSQFRAAYRLSPSAGRFDPPGEPYPPLRWNERNGVG